MKPSAALEELRRVRSALRETAETLRRGNAQGSFTTSMDAGASAAYQAAADSLAVLEHILEALEA